MMSDVRIVTVTPDGEPGAELGTLTLVGDQIEATPGLADQTLASLRRRSRLDDTSLFSRLARDGWSNGQIMIVS